MIEARGLVVAPGFIDVHTHADGWLLKTRNFLPKTSQGFTTEILMPDGISYAPLTPQTWPDWCCYLRSLDGLSQEDYRGWRSIADYLALLEGATAQNAAAQIPYANVRVLAGGWRRPSSALQWSARDNVGIRSGRILVDGQSRQQVESNCDATRPVPCPNVSGATEDSISICRTRPVNVSRSASLRCSASRVA